MGKEQMGGRPTPEHNLGNRLKEALRFSTMTAVVALGVIVIANEAVGRVRRFAEGWGGVKTKT
ncbi:MAG: hypothetical protein Q8Q92_03640 [bacterium]|nr:hypothetical protein [bacterium]